MKQLVKNIRCLAGVEYESKLRLQGKEMAELNTIDDAWLLVAALRFLSDGVILAWFPRGGKRGGSSSACFACAFLGRLRHAGEGPFPRFPFPDGIFSGYPVK